MFGPNQAVAPISSIDFKNYLVSQPCQPATLPTRGFHFPPPSPCPQVTEEDLEEIKNKAACSIKTVIHRTDTREEDRAGESIRRGLVVNVGKKILSFSFLIPSCLLLCLSPRAGENIKYLAIRVLNKNREVLISPPGSNRKYRVKLTIPTMDKDFGTTQITYSRENRDRVVFMASDRVRDAHQVRFDSFCCDDSS